MKKIQPYLFVALLTAASCTGSPGNAADEKSRANQEPIGYSTNLSDSDIRHIMEDRTPKNYCILVDYSGVRASDDERKQYASNVEEVLLQVLPGDRVNICKITENSIAEPKYLLSKTFDGFVVKRAKNDRNRLKEQKAFFQEFQQLLGEEVEKVKASILSDSVESKRTDIISAIHLASNLLRQKESLQPKLIVISDMEENSTIAKFTQAPPEDGEAQVLIEKEKKSIRGLPELRGVPVKVIGAKSASQDAFFKIRNFWLKFFSESGGIIDETDYSAAI